ncbi:hypothetical protein [Nocardia bovistercoris]|uniref:Uncharacterized protein n=1 Tax=Nocardia bovistercoris TaxID=2785916 RepID=A0A931IE85_9NOCA|nr:hypothetical protein [Nocardia bovistercoris]MBH0779591.1 hypothetical protein [Nocardia bovistercoris]
MLNKATKVSAAAAIALSIGALAAPAASAAPATTPSATAVGSVAVCLNVPIGPISISVCL